MFGSTTAAYTHLDYVRNERQFEYIIQVDIFMMYDVKQTALVGVVRHQDASVGFKTSADKYVQMHMAHRSHLQVQARL